MTPIRLRSAAEQVAERLRSEIRGQNLSGEMPGIHQLAESLLVNHKTVKAALHMLESEGLLLSQGSGKPRRIVAAARRHPPALRIAILLYEPDDRKIDHFLDLQNRLRETGHNASFASKTLIELGMDMERIRKFVTATEADAWVVVAGSRPVLEWFTAQTAPVFGLFGRTVGLPLASTNPLKMPALKTALRHLASLGHRRILMLAREERRKPSPGALEQGFLDELQELGMPTGPYNLPDWEESPEGFHRALDALFRYTPPTAILVQGAPLTVAALRHFTIRGIRVPRDVSLVCMDPDPVFAWCDPGISHIAYDSLPWLRRVVRWANNVARGKDDRRKGHSPVKFIEGGTTGPAKG